MALNLNPNSVPFRLYCMRKWIGILLIALVVVGGCSSSGGTDDAAAKKDAAAGEASADKQE